MSAIPAPVDLSASRRRVHLVGAVSSGMGLQAVLVVSGVVAARLLGPANRGTLALLVVLSSVMCQLGALGISVAMAYFVSRRRAHAREIVRTLRPLALAQVGGVLLAYVATLGIVFRHASGPVLAAAAFSLFLVPASYGLEYGLALLQGLGELASFNLLRVAPNAIYSAALLLAYAAGMHSLPGVAGIAAASWVSAALIVLGYARRALRVDHPPTEETPPNLRSVVSFGWRSALGLLSSVDSFRLDQLMVAAIVSTRALGYYVVAAAFTNLPRFLAQSVGAVAFPRVAASDDPRREGRFYVASGIAFSVAVGGVLALATPLLIHFLFGSRFAPAITPGRILAAGAVFYASRRIISDVARGRGLPSLGSYGEAVTLATFCASAPVLGGMFGLDGIATSYAVAGVTGLVTVVAVARRRGV